MIPPQFAKNKKKKKFPGKTSKGNPFAAAARAKLAAKSSGKKGTMSFM